MNDSRCAVEYWAMSTVDCGGLPHNTLAFSQNDAVLSFLQTAYFL